MSSPQLAESTRDVLFAAAALGRTFVVADLAAVLGRRPSDLLPALREALDAELLRDAGASLAFADDCVHARFYGDLPRAVRTAFHAQAGAALAGAGRDAAVVADQLARGDGPAEEIVHWLHRAALAALPRDASSAAAFLELAVSRCDVPPPAVLDDLAWALVQAGRPADVLDVVAHALPGEQDPQHRCSLRQARAKALIALGEAAASVAELEDALAEPEVPTAERPRILSELALRRLHLRRFAQAAEAAVGAERAGSRSGDRQVVCAALSARSWIALLAGDASEALSLAERAVGIARRDPTGRSGVVNPWANLVLAQLQADRLHEVEATLVAARASPQGQWSGRVYDVLLALRSMLAGDWIGAERSLAVRSSTAGGQAVLEVWACALQAALAVHRGTLARARRELLAGRALLEARGGEQLGAAWLTWSQALLDEQEGDVVRAADGLLGLWERAGKEDAVGEVLESAPDAVRLAVAAGRREAAAEVVEQVTELALRAGTRTARGVAQHARGLLDRDVAGLEAAADLLAAVGRRPAAAQAREDAGCCAPDPVEAQRLLAQAAQEHAEVGATRARARAQHRLRELGVRPGQRGSRRRAQRGWASLTEAERAVGRLAAEGLTNRDIGARLFVSSRTVGSHLSSAYRKLGVNGRAALASALVEESDISVI